MVLPLPITEVSKLNDVDTMVLYHSHFKKNIESFLKVRNKNSQKSKSVFLSCCPFVNLLQTDCYKFYEYSESDSY